MQIFTIGHSTRTLDVFVDLLKNAGADFVADVRRFPHSKRQTQFNIEQFPASLASHGIGYEHIPDLGGRRPKRRDGKPSPNTLWREQAFQNYADYAETPPFRKALTGVIELVKTKRPALMCAEALWWQCHRRIIADYLLAAGVEVFHIMENKIEPAHLTPGAKIGKNGNIIYSDTPLLDIA